jgi:hypothetical protein
MINRIDYKTSQDSKWLRKLDFQCRDCSVQQKEWVKLLKVVCKLEAGPRQVHKREEVQIRKKWRGTGVCENVTLSRAWRPVDRFPELFRVLACYFGILFRWFLSNFTDLAPVEPQIFTRLLHISAIRPMRNRIHPLLLHEPQLHSAHFVVSNEALATESLHYNNLSRV